MKDSAKLVGKRALLNVVIRDMKGARPGQYAVFGYILNLPPELTKNGDGRGNGMDLHMLMEVSLDKGGTRFLRHTWNQGPEDIMEEGIPAFSNKWADYEEPE